MPGAPASQSWAFHGREDDRSPSTLTVPDTFMFSLLRPLPVRGPILEPWLLVW